MFNKETSKKKGSDKGIDKIVKAIDRIDTTQETIQRVDATNKAISETLYIKDNVAVDLKNFSLISISSHKELLS